MQARGLGKAVAGEGSQDSRIFFVGEAPGRKEAESGRPFVGKAGQWLREAIRGIGLHEGAVYLTSPIKYRPARRQPTAADIAHGRIHLLRPDTKGRLPGQDCSQSPSIWR